VGEKSVNAGRSRDAGLAEKEDKRAVRRSRPAVAAVFLAALFFFIGGLFPRHANSVSGEAFTIVVLPDTGVYAWKYPDIFHA